MTTAMTSPEVSTQPTAERITWTTVARGFSVASRDGEYVGCVDEVEGGFVVRDSRNGIVGRRETLDDAREALRVAVDGGITGAAPASDELWRRAAAVSAVIAGGVLLTAGTLAPWL